MAPSSAGSSPHVPACAGFTSGTRSRRSRTWDHPRSRGVYDRDFKAAGDVLGSSPLARGLLGPLGPADIAYGIIPARAGFTPSTRRQSRSTSGSSPLARGLRRPARPPHLHDRIIPARAGFTPRTPPTRSAERDHPRSRGVYGAGSHSGDVSVGSSPLARGLPVRSWRSWRSPGIIPARAGFTACTRVARVIHQDHPRSRGVYAAPSRRRLDPCGSSPLARGLPRIALGRANNGWIIPARAGFTRRRRRHRHCRPGSSPLARGLRGAPTPRSQRAADHPRSRGVYPQIVDRGGSGGGSSPLARGLRHHPRRGTIMPGIIPARAGFTRRRCRPRHRRRDHPRSRGVYLLTAPGAVREAGSSPLARGLQPPRSQFPAPQGIIPARAGFTGAHRGRRERLADHPRSRGVYWCAMLASRGFVGSSPLARGLPGSLGLGSGRDRIIPARAGFTAIMAPAATTAADHPRSRGVYYAGLTFGLAVRGSSPLARGLLGRGVGGVGGKRIIPARAGFTPGRRGRRHGPWDHPRSRGVYELGTVVGDPPARIIPARAGFTLPVVHRHSSSPDHPRSRGVYWRDEEDIVRPVGSSPLARGLPRHAVAHLLIVRIIPARAGFTSMAWQAM